MLRRTGGGKLDFTKPNLLAFQNNHLPGRRHLKNVGKLNRRTAIMTSEPSDDDPEYYAAIRASDAQNKKY